MMKTTEQVTQEIKTEWFNNHQAEWVKEPSITSLHWKDEGKPMKDITYLFLGNKLVVTGDIGDAIFSFPKPITLETFNNAHPSFLMKNLSCSSVNRWVFNQNKAKAELKEWLQSKVQLTYEYDIHIERQNEAFRELHDKLFISLDDNTTIQSFDNLVWNEYEDSSLDMESEEWETISEFGREHPVQFRSYLIGLQMALNQLNKENDTL